MKSVIFYYSYSGNNRLLAEYLSEILKIEAYPIIEKKRRSRMTIALDVIFNRRSEIKIPKVFINHFDNVLLLAPLWGSKIANPMKTFLEQVRGDLNNYSFITFCGGNGPSNQKEKIANELNRLVGHPARDIFELKIKNLFPKKQQNKITTISRYKARRSDFIGFKDEINKILAQFSDQNKTAALLDKETHLQSKVTEQSANEAFY